MSSHQPRRPGEVLFNLAMVAGSLVLLWSAYGISGFEALSAPGSVPMATTFIMVICAGMILRESLAKTANTTGRVSRDILPMPIIITIVSITGYAFLLKPLGFLPTSFLFLTALIAYLKKSSLIWSATASLGVVILIYLVFRIIFKVLMPEGIVPEGEIIAWITSLFVSKAP
jgi:hypothetical protein